MESVDCVVIGAGVIGLAVSRRLAMAGREVIVLETEGIVGSHTSSRNSEVIHAGIYYPPGSRKARVCVEGRRALYPLLRGARGPVRERRQADRRQRGERGAEASTRSRRRRRRTGWTISSASAATRSSASSPRCGRSRGSSRLPPGSSTAIALMHAYEGDAADAGAMIAFRSPVEAEKPGKTVSCSGSAGSRRWRSLAGPSSTARALFAEKVARSLAGVPPETIPRQHLGKGNYYSLTGVQPFSHLVYPMPGPSVLGVHVGLDLAGRCRFGPEPRVGGGESTTRWIRGGRNASMPRCGPSTPSFATGACNRTTRGSGPKLHGPGEPQPDFVIQGAEAHGIPGLMNLYGDRVPRSHLVSRHRGRGRRPRGQRVNGPFGSGRVRAALTTPFRGPYRARSGREGRARGQGRARPRRARRCPSAARPRSPAASRS